MMRGCAWLLGLTVLIVLVVAVIGANLPNTGRHSWQVPAGVPVEVYLRLRVRDNAGNEAVGTHGHVVRRFAARTAVTKQFPTGSIALDIRGQHPLEATVVPFHQVGIDLGDLPAGRSIWLVGRTSLAGDYPFAGGAIIASSSPTYHG